MPHNMCYSFDLYIGCHKSQPRRNVTKEIVNFDDNFYFLFYVNLEPLVPILGLVQSPLPTDREIFQFDVEIPSQISQ